MIEVSCFYIHYNIHPLNFTFIKYKKFIKVCVENRVINILIKNLKNYTILYDLYILSLLCTENPSQIEKTMININDKIKYIYEVSTEKYWKTLYFYGKYTPETLEMKAYKNPFLSQEPKRETSMKKQYKLLKQVYELYDSDLLPDPFYIITKYIEAIRYRVEIETKDIINYEKKIYLLCCIKKFNNDIYMNILKFM